MSLLRYGALYLPEAGGATVELVAQDASHGQTVGNVDLVQHHVLVVDSATHGHTAESPTLSTVGPVPLTVADATHAHSAESPTLTQHHVLAADSTLHGHTAGNVALVQHHVLDAQDATHAHTADLVVWVQAVTYGKVTARIPATAGVAAATPARSTVTAVSNPVF